MISQTVNLYVDLLIDLADIQPARATVVHVGEDGSTHVGNGTAFIKQE